MQRTIRLRLQPTIRQSEILLDTIQQHASCFNAVAIYGWEHGEKNGVELHKATYYHLRSEHPTLPAQLVCASRVMATEAIKSALVLKGKGRKVSCLHSEMPAIRYDVRTYRVLSDRCSQCRILIEMDESLRIHEETRDYISRSMGLLPETFNDRWKRKHVGKKSAN